MKTNYLLPEQFKKIGWLLFIPGILLGLFYLVTQNEPHFLSFKLWAIADEPILGSTSFFTTTKTNVIDEIIGLLVIIGSVFIAFSKEKREDEFISKIRLESLVWATYLNYTILVLAIIFVFGMTFFWAIVFNMFTILFFFIIRFNWVLYRSKIEINDEK